MQLLDRKHALSTICICICSAGILIFLLSAHLSVAFKGISVYLTWHTRSNVNRAGLHFSRDGFDQTFRFYARNQTTSRPTPDIRFDNGVPDRGSHKAEDVVPPILHHILIGMDWKTAPQSWHVARNKCLDYHPGWETHFWDESKAVSFLEQEYPWFLETWNSYPYVIQKADSLRYFALYHYGGVFLDLDLSCRRSLGPLRQFATTAISATPAGVSNGFMMASARHPFFKQLIHALPRYNLNWLHSYVTIMYSGGPMFLSSEWMYFQGEEKDRLRILDRRFHRLSGRVTTPLFDHLGASSWHQEDTVVLKRIFRHLASFPFLILLTASGIVFYLFFKWYQRQRRHLVAGHMLGHRSSAAVWVRVPVQLDAPLRTKATFADDEEALLPLYSEVSHK